MSAKEQDLVSVIVNNYNKGMYLQQCLDSIYNQTYDNIEIVFWDDNSTDNSIAVFDKWLASKRTAQRRSVKYCSTKSSLSLYSGEKFVPLGVTRWLALQECTGKYVAICDSDDYWSPNKLWAQVAFNGFANSVGVSFTNCYIVDRDGLFLEKQYSDKYQIPKKLTSFRNDYSQFFESKNVYRELLTKRNFMAFSSVVFDREKLMSVVGKPTHYTSGEDYDWLLKVASKYDCVYYPVALTYYRETDNSLTRSKRSGTRATWYEIDAVVSSYNRNKRYKYRVVLHLVKLYAKLLWKQFVREEF